MIPGKAAVASCKQEPGITAPIVDLKRCEGKGDCVGVCPEFAITLGRFQTNQ